MKIDEKRIIDNRAIYYIRIWADDRHWYFGSLLYRGIQGKEVWVGGGPCL